MAKPVFVRFSPAKRKEFDQLLKSLKREAPKPWKAPGHTELVGALLVLVREAATRAKLKDALGTYYEEG